MTTYTLAILGGTGHEGSGLGLRWARAGHTVLIGSRSAEKAEAAAAAMNARLGQPLVRGLENAQAAQAADIVVLTVPYAAHQATLESVRAAVQGKVFVDVTVPLVPPKVSRVQLPAGGSASQEAQALLGPGVRVVTAFQNISAEHLKDPDHPIDCDVLVCGDDKDAKALVIQLAADAGMQAWDAGPLANAVVPEGLTSVLIGLNARYKVKSSGLKLTGLG
ncbi:MAG: NADPH-dependent F420 reductase [Anaerolineales bacterium]|nr:NADPH-dependent F420 reductase [Anaerolineales bacterium]